MFGRVEFTLAARYLRSRKSEGFLSVIVGFALVGILLAVATLIIVMSVMNGFRKELVESLLGASGHVFLYGGEAPLSDYDALALEVEAMEGVAAASAVVDSQVIVTTHGRSQGVLVRGVGDAAVGGTSFADAVREGSLEGFGEGLGVIVGSGLASKLNVAPGDAVTLVAPQASETLFGGVPRLKSYAVAAVFELGLYQADHNLILMPLKAAQTFFSRKEQVDYIEVRIDDPSRTDEALARLAPLVERHRLVARDWRETNTEFLNALKVERNVMGLILTLMITVAAFNIISGLVMLVKDKNRDIAILRTLGLSRGSVQRVFILSGFSIGAVGTVLGVGFGMLIAANIEAIRRWIEYMAGAELFSQEVYFLARLPSHLVWQDVALAASISLGLSFLATLYPSWRAARIEPAEALRRV